MDQIKNLQILIFIHVIPIICVSILLVRQFVREGRRALRVGPLAEAVVVVERYSAHRRVAPLMFQNKNLLQINKKNNL